jgi:hypothetical protein
MPPAADLAIHAEIPGTASRNRRIEDVSGQEPPVAAGGLAGQLGPATGADCGPTRVSPVGSAPLSAAYAGAGSEAAPATAPPPLNSATASPAAAAGGATRGNSQLGRSQRRGPMLLDPI